MTPIRKLKNKLTEIADNIRDKSGETEKMTIDEMNQNIAWLESEVDETETYILVDADGNEIAAVATEEIVEITATPNDVREGKTVVTGEGIEVGTKEIPSYNTTEGFKLIPAGEDFVIPLTEGKHDYTKLQAVLCPFNTSLTDSVASEKVVINDNVYPVQSMVPESSVTVVNNPNVIDLGIINTAAIPWLIRYFTYKEIY